MYAFETMIELGLNKPKKWKSPAHRIVAVNALIGNPRITNQTSLAENIDIINSIPKDRIKKVTVWDLFKMGVHLHN